MLLLLVDSLNNNISFARKALLQMQRTRWLEIVPDRLRTKLLFFPISSQSNS